MKRPYYLPIRKCSSVWTWLLYRRVICGRAVWRIAGWDFYG